MPKWPWRRGEVDAFGADRAVPAEPRPEPVDEPVVPEALESPVDWSGATTDNVPPWRRADRERVDQIRGAAPEPEDRKELASQAGELHRLVDLHRDGVITDAELVEAARGVID